ncbi:transcriptional regulatory protein [Mycobacterium tuberculosis 94_M4241A]|nr:transcriptional regulatory protein [Mycobacterium tuberculosis 94_M4241A]
MPPRRSFGHRSTGFVMLELAGFYGDRGAAVEPVLAAMTVTLLVALGDSPERAQCSLRAEQTQKNTLGRAT